MSDTGFIQCVECGYSFDLDDAEIVSYATSAVRCPECGRCNFCSAIEQDGIHVQDEEDIDETDEIFMEDYLSDDLEYDGANKLDYAKQKRIGVAKRTGKVPSQPVFEYRRIIAQNMSNDFGTHGKGRTHTELEDAMFDYRRVEDAEQ
jgi:DNA-directed RNA polymerase subunit RPC12/RpoP